MVTQLYHKLSPRKDRERVQKAPLFPLDVECRVSGFDDDPYKEYTGYFRRLENHTCVIFHYGSLFRIAHLDYLGNLIVWINETDELWDFYMPVEKKRVFFIRMRKKYSYPNKLVIYM